MFSFGVYYRQLIFFGLVILLIGLIFWYINSTKTGASPEELKLPSTPTAQVELKLADGGKLTVNGLPIRSAFSFGKTTDHLEYQVYNQEGSQIKQLTTVVLFPHPTLETQGIIARDFTDGTFKTEPPKIQADQLQFVASELGPKSIYSIEVILPKGIVEPNFIQSLSVLLSSLPQSVWSTFSLGLAVFSLLLILLLIRHRFTFGPMREKSVRDKPPDNTPPAVVAVLVNGRVSPRCLAATLLDLAARGYLQLVTKSTGYSLGRRRPTDLDNQARQTTKLLSFEKTILGKIFTSHDHRTSDRDLKFRIGQSVFSHQIAQSYLEIYDEATTLGWFYKNPQKIYSGYRLIALITILTAFSGAIWNYFLTDSITLNYLIGWATLFLLGVLMYRTIPFLPKRTGQGQNVYREWLKFKNYLTINQSIGIDLTSTQAQSLYQQYLSYAIVLGVEVEWTRRFASLPFRVPDWYLSEREVRVVEEFANSLFPMIGNIAYELSRAREPFAV